MLENSVEGFRFGMVGQEVSVTRASWPHATVAGLKDALLDWPELGLSLLVEGEHPRRATAPVGKSVASCQTSLEAAAYRISKAAYILHVAEGFTPHDALHAVLAYVQTNGGIQAVLDITPPLDGSRGTPGKSEWLDMVLLAAYTLAHREIGEEAVLERLEAILRRSAVFSIAKLDFISLLRGAQVLAPTWELEVAQPSAALQILQRWSGAWAFGCGHRQDHRPLSSEGFSLPVARALLAWQELGGPYIPTDLTEREMYLHVTGLEEVRGLLQNRLKG